MYKSDICNAIERIALVPGGAVEGLLTQIQAAAEMLAGAFDLLASHDDARIKTGVTRLHEAIQLVLQRLVQISPSGTAIELHLLADRFDSVLRDFPDLEGLLSPGRQSLAHLASAHDETLQKSRSSASVTSLIAPGVALANCYAHYSAVSALLTPSVASGTASFSTIRMGGENSLESLAAITEMLSYLASVATSVVEQAEGDSVAHAMEDIWIAGLDSGSPIEIKLQGNSKTLELMLTMLRDLFRLPYLYLTSHGRLVQAMETLARARELGIDSPEALAHLQSAVERAAQQYAGVFQRHETVTINGKIVNQDPNPAKSVPETQVALEAPKTRMLPPPTEDE